MRYALLGFFALAIPIAIGVAAYIQLDPTLQEVRDIVVIAVLSLLVTVRLLTRALGELRRETVQPALDDLRAGARNVRGATEFMTDSAVHPVIRAVSVTRGIRRGIALITRIGRRGG